MRGELHHPDQPMSCEFVVRGHLGELLLYAFPDLEPETRDGDTILRGVLPDRAALHGVLAEIEALGIELLALQRLPLEPGNLGEQREQGDGGRPQEAKP
ncbi:MAG: hypothetical protein ACLQVK_06545 [Acidimicrobiales bacterium]